MDSQPVNNGRPRQADEGLVDMAARGRFLRGPKRLRRARNCPYCNRMILYAENFCLHILVQCPRRPHLLRNPFPNPDQRRPVPGPVPHPLPVPPQTQSMPHPLPIPPTPAMLMPEVGSRHPQQPHLVLGQVNGNVRNNIAWAYNGLLFGRYGRNVARGSHVVYLPPAGIRRDNMVLPEATAPPQPGIVRAQNPETQIDLELRLGLPKGE